MFANVLSCVLFITLAAVSIQGAPQFDCCNLDDFCQRPMCRPPCGFYQGPPIYRVISTSAPAPEPAPSPAPKLPKSSSADPCSYCCACKIGSACKPTACYVPHICIKPKISVQPKFACYKPICYGEGYISGDATPCPADCTCGCCNRNCN